MTAIITSIRKKKSNLDTASGSAAKDKAASMICDRDRLLSALASRPFLDKEIGEQLMRDIEEAREASIAGIID